MGRFLYSNIIEEREKAIHITIKEGEFNGVNVWLPKCKIKINEKKSEIAVTKKFYLEKVEELRAKSSPSKEERFIQLDTRFDFANDKSVGKKIKLLSVTGSELLSKMIFFPKSLLRGEKIEESFFRKQIDNMLLKLNRYEKSKLIGYTNIFIDGLVSGEKYRQDISFYR